MDPNAILIYISDHDGATVAEIMHVFGTRYGETRDHFARLEAEGAIVRDGKLVYKATHKGHAAAAFIKKKDAPEPPNDPDDDPELPPEELDAKRAELLRRLMAIQQDGNAQTPAAPTPPETGSYDKAAAEKRRLRREEFLRRSQSRWRPVEPVGGTAPKPETPPDPDKAMFAKWDEITTELHTPRPRNAHCAIPSQNGEHAESADGAPQDPVAADGDEIDYDDEWPENLDDLFGDDDDLIDDIDLFGDDDDDGDDD